MKILEYIGLDTRRVKAQYQKITEAIARDDFRSAEVKKLANIGQGKFYRAKLDYSNRLLFALVRHGEDVCALMLEVIENHAYDKSRFLRGAEIDEAKIPDADPLAEAAEAQPLRYLHPERASIHLLDKPISFDDAQEAIYRHQPPLIVVGSAGSGKTALTLEKLKHAEGDVLYLTHSAFLAQNARDLYFANGFEHRAQEATFLSYREFVESIRVPAGREATWRDFAGWFARMRRQFRDLDSHQAFEEIRGVVTAQAEGVLSREQYLALGVRQSIFQAETREQLYDLFQKYRDWLAEARLYDLNLVAQECQALAAPRYDFLVIDEVQDITPVQLALVLKTLKRPGHFLLCGDSNQIVHPNFFSWSQVKCLFWRDEALAQKQELAVLNANFRNGIEATRVANTLLKIKHRRFGSIDRESNFLVQAIGGERGQVDLLPDKETVTRELDQKTRQSTQFAVLVMRDEDKAEARRRFATPLLFSIHEAKGLEYDNIVLYRFVSDHRAEFAEIVEGVTAADLTGDSLDYRRAKDKADKSLEVYKFFVNALYVALTRAVKNLYLIESDAGHPLFALLGLTQAGQVKVEAKAASLEEWQREARKLELQGKQEQAEAIRDSILKQKPVPWPVFDEPWLRGTLTKVFRDQAPGGKPRQQLLEYAAWHNQPMLAAWLDTEAHFTSARAFHNKQRQALVHKYLSPYGGRNFKEVLRQCDQHGVDHRTPMNQTPLMAAARAGNVPLVEALLERGADPQAVDQYGCNALHWALREAFHDQGFARGPFPALYELIAPSSLDLQTAGRLVRIDRHLAEYLPFQTLWSLFQTRFTWLGVLDNCAFGSEDILLAWEALPANVLRPERNKRQHLASVLSRNEVDRDYAYNRALFKRVARGWYQFNPALAVRRRVGEADAWIPVFQALNLPLINEAIRDDHRDALAGYLQQAGLPPVATPIAIERHEAKRLQLLEMKRQQAIAEEKRRQDAADQRQRQRQERPVPREEVDARDDDPPWGTPAARKLALERLRYRIERSRQKQSKREK